jgi:SSS family solute:Na+ symporter
MRTVDWILVAATMALVLGVATYTRRFVRSVADFLAAGRCAGRYLLGNARGESDSGLANTMAKFEIVLVAGFVVNFWEKLQVLVLLLVGISGFVVYRYRETRALTLAQFLEMRYSRSFRLFMGSLAFVSGILNYGIFPAVSARFFIYFLHLPTTVHIGSFVVSTFAVIMASYLLLTVFIVMTGGQVTLMVTDCVEGLLSHAIYIVVAIAVLFVVGWSQVVQVMSSPPAGKSMINPFDAHDVEDFNVWFVLMYLAIQVYQTMALQNKQGFNASARTPHESRMGYVLGNWRTYARMLMVLMLGVCAVTYLKHPDFAHTAVPINAEINSIVDPSTGSPDKYLQKQMTIPVTLSYLLPVGIKGLFCAMMIMGLFAGDSGHMHSWGSIFVQDVVLPLRKKPLTPRQHIWALRFAVMAVAAFAFAFSLLFRQTQYIQMWWNMTAALFVGGAGAAIIGGLYWRRGTTQAAWAAQIAGSLMFLAGVLLTSGPGWNFLVDNFGSAVGLTLPPKFWLNGTQMAFLGAGSAVVVYIVVSLLTCRTPFNLDRMLHRGAYAPAGGPDHEKAPVPLRERFRLRNLLHFGPDFTFRDKLASAGLFWFALSLLAVNLVVTAWNFIAPEMWTLNWWSHYWIVFGLALPFVVAVVTFVWFTIGGTRDIVDLFASLRTMRRDAADDGRVEEVDKGDGFEVVRGFEVGPTANCDPPVETAPPVVTPAAAGPR